jgi:restriction system protein
MALWLVRGGSEGEHEARFLAENRVYATWWEVNIDLSKLDWDGLLSALQGIYADAPKARLTNWGSQLYPFAHDMRSGDWIVMPRKNKPLIAFAEIAGDYQYNPKAEEPCFHYRQVKWLKTDVPRETFDQDLLYSFGAFMTICRLQRNDAEARVRSIAAAGWKPTHEPIRLVGDAKSATDATPSHAVDIEEIARDSISKRIIARFKGHGMARLVEAILNAQGYDT